MNKLNTIIKNIDDHKDEIIALLQNLIKKESYDGGPTDAQTIVIDELKKLDFEVETFKGINEKIKQYPDYCEPGFNYDENAYNVGAIKKGNDKKSLLLFGHIDTEEKDYFGTFKDPFETNIIEDKIYGLGASDDKGGIAMMLAALKYTSQVVDLPYEIKVLSILGKHGGAFGTLSAIEKGYNASHGIYLHPAETGQGFSEIKNISLGVVDLDIKIKGQDGKTHDDLDTGVNANHLCAKVISALNSLNENKRKERLFDFGSFKNTPSYILNIGSINSDNGYGGISLNTELKVRIRFFMPETIDSICKETISYLKEKLGIDYKYLEIKQGNFRATPAYIPNDDPFVKMIENDIRMITNEENFIHQYHGGSDIRLPIIYGNCKCVGIGPLATLPAKNSYQKEWIAVDDYLNGVKILAAILLDFIDDQTLTKDKTF